MTFENFKSKNEIKIKKILLNIFYVFAVYFLLLKKNKQKKTVDKKDAAIYVICRVLSKCSSSSRWVTMFKTSSELHCAFKIVHLFLVLRGCATLRAHVRACVRVQSRM